MNQRFYILIIAILAGIVIYQWNELNEKIVTASVQNKEKEKEKELLERKNKDITKIYCEVVRVPTEAEIDEAIRIYKSFSKKLKELQAELELRNEERKDNSKENQDIEYYTYSSSFFYKIDKTEARKKKKDFKEDKLLEDIILAENVLKNNSYHQEVSLITIKADAIVTTAYIGHWENDSHNYLFKYDLAEVGISDSPMKIWKVGLADGRELLVRRIEAKNKYGYVVEKGIRHLH